MSAEVWQLLTAEGRLDVDADAPSAYIIDAVKSWVHTAVPPAWVEAGSRGGPTAVREVRTRPDYESWYPVFGRSGLVVPTWPVEYGGLGVARRAWPAGSTRSLRRYNLGRLNPLGLNLAAPALFAHGTEDQRLRYLPPIVRNEEVWCQLFSEPGSGSDLASLSTRAERDGDEWVVTGQKVWTTWAHLADFGVLLARTDPDVPEARGHHLLSGRPPPARRRGPTTAPHRRRGRFQRGIPRVALGSPTPSGSAKSAEDGRSPTRPCLANARWCRARGRVGSTASAGPAPTI